MNTPKYNKSHSLDPIQAFTVMMLLSLAQFAAACGSIQVDIEENVTPSQEAAVIETDAQQTEVSESTPIDLHVNGPGPDLVWLPFAFGLDETRQVVMVNDGMAGFAQSPVDFQLYFDYSPATGRLLYASQFWHAAQGSNQSVTDLWVYDYATGQSTQLFSDGVGRAAWSPNGDALAVATFNPSLGIYELGVMDSDDSMEIVASCASTSFSWSPDGDRIAYEAGGGVDEPLTSGPCSGIYVIDLGDRSVVRISDQPPSNGGWHGDQPIWAEGQDALLLTFSSPESVFAVVPLDGSGAFTVTKSGAIPIEYLPNPEQTVWSQEHNSVVGYTEGMFDPNGVWVYQFSDDMRIVEDAYRITIDGEEPGLILIGWWEPGESVLLRDISNTSAQNPFGRALVYSLADRSWFEVPHLPQ